MMNTTEEIVPTVNTDNFTYIADYSCLYTQTFLLLCFCIITISILSNVFGNILILTSAFRFSGHFKGSLYLLICNLAVSDLLLGISLIMYPMEHFLPNMAEEKAFCYSRMCVLLIAFSSSVQSLLLISIDRFLAIMFPIRHYRLTVEKKSNIRFGLALIWVISLICGTLPVTANSEFRKDDFVCRNGLLLSTEIDIFNASAVLVEFMVSITLYSIIIHSIRRRTLTLTERRKRRLNVKTNRMILVFIVYALCWLPYIATTFVIVTETSERTQERLFCIREHLVLMGVLNSGINWIIYGLTNLKFRRAFKLILLCKRQWRQISCSTQLPIAAVSYSSHVRDAGH